MHLYLIQIESANFFLTVKTVMICYITKPHFSNGVNFTNFKQYYNIQATISDWELLKYDHF